MPRTAPATTTTTLRWARAGLLSLPRAPLARKRAEAGDKYEGPFDWIPRANCGANCGGGAQISLSLASARHEAL